MPGNPYPGESFAVFRMEEANKNSSPKGDISHPRDVYTIRLLLKARGKYVVDFYTHTLSANQIYFINPGQMHQLLEEEPSHGYTLLFSSRFMLENDIPLCFMEDLNLFNDYGLCPPLKLSPAEMAPLSDYADKMLNYLKGKERFKFKAIAALLELFLINCNALASGPPEKGRVREAGGNILKAFKKQVEENYRQWHHASAYARALNISPDHLNRTVKALTGKTAKEYIQSRITTEAKRHLYFTEASAKEIAYRLGFSNPAHFSSFFKKCTGKSPSFFRKQNIGF